MGSFDCVLVSRCPGFVDIYSFVWGICALLLSWEWILHLKFQLHSKNRECCVCVLFIYLYIYIYIYMCVCVLKYIYIYIYTHTHTHNTHTQFLSFLRKICGGGREGERERASERASERAQGISLPSLNICRPPLGSPWIFKHRTVTLCARHQVFVDLFWRVDNRKEFQVCSSSVTS